MMIPEPYNFLFSVRGPALDDTNQLVAYRGRNKLGKDTVTYRWFVSFRGVVFAIISRRDSKWVHDNWVHDYIASTMEGVITRDNREAFDAELIRLIDRIRDAIPAKTAETVTLPISV